VFILFLATLYTHIEFYDEVAPYTVPILAAFAGYYFFYEVAQIIIRRLDYVRDFWNIFDFFRAILLIVFVIMESIDKDT